MSYVPGSVPARTCSMICCLRVLLSAAQIFMTLIEKGADPFAKDKNGETPVSLVFKISAKTEKKEPPMEAKKQFVAEIRRHMKKAPEETERQA